MLWLAGHISTGIIGEKITNMKSTCGDGWHGGLAQGLNFVQDMAGGTKTNAHRPEPYGPKQAQDVIEERQEHRNDGRCANVEGPPNKAEQGEVVDAEQRQLDALLPVYPRAQARVRDVGVGAAFNKCVEGHRPNLWVPHGRHSRDKMTAHKPSLCIPEL